MSAGEPMDAPPSRQGRSLTGFYVAVGIVAVLVGLGALLYGPLRLRYAIYRVRRTPSSKKAMSGFPGIRDADRWLLICLEGARKGNRAAMEVVVDNADAEVMVPICPGVFGPRSVAFEAVVAQPDLFFAVLDERDDAAVFRLMEQAMSPCSSRFGNIPKAMSCGDLLLYWLEGGLESGDENVRHAVQKAIEFTRRRFAKELSEAAKAEAPPK